MSITRDPDYPADYAALVSAFNRCADGHSANAVLNASLQMVAAAIGYIAAANGYSLEHTLTHTERAVDRIRAEVRDNFQRKAQPSDVEVKLQ